jgi:hypothetical protein
MGIGVSESFVILPNVSLEVEFLDFRPEFPTRLGLGADLDFCFLPFFPLGADIWDAPQHRGTLHQSLTYHTCVSKSNLTKNRLRQQNSDRTN